MEKFLEFLAVEGCEYEIKDGSVRVLDRLMPYWVSFDNIIIPENTDFAEGLYLEGYEGEIQFPDSFKVAKILALMDTNIKRLSPNLTVYDDCSVYLDAHKIENVSYSDRCGFLGRTIFAFWANNDFLIAAGCFTGTYSEFEERIKTARYYSKADATEYKRKVRGCISRLAKKLGKPDPFKKAAAN